MCGAGLEREAKRVLLTLDVTEAAAEKAAALGCDAVVSHHPLIFRPIGRLTSPKLLMLAKHEIAVMSFHTRLDNLDGGVNDELAAVLGLIGAVKYGEGGTARLGQTSFTRFADFAAHVKKALGAPVLHIVQNAEETGPVLVLGGDGKDFYPDALRAKGTFVTGAMGYHAMAAAADDGVVNVIEAGHFHTEQPVLRVLERMIRQADAAIDVRFFASDPITVI